MLIVTTVSKHFPHIYKHSCTVCKWFSILHKRFCTSCQCSSQPFINVLQFIGVFLLLIISILSRLFLLFVRDKLNCVKGNVLLLSVTWYITEHAVLVRNATQDQLYGVGGSRRAGAREKGAGGGQN